MMGTKLPLAPSVRFRVDPAYVPADKAARRMGLTLRQFQGCARQLYARGVPLPDETTGLYDLEAIDHWRKRQRPDLYPEVTGLDLVPEIARPKVDWERASPRPRSTAEKSVDRGELVHTALGRGTVRRRRMIHPDDLGAFIDLMRR